MCPLLWQRQAPCVNFSPFLTPYVSTCFPFLFGVSVKCVTQGETRVSLVDVCVEMGSKALFTLASISCGYPASLPSHQQLPALHYTSTLLILPGRFGHILQDVVIPALGLLMLSSLSSSATFTLSKVSSVIWTGILLSATRCPCISTAIPVT